MVNSADRPAIPGSHAPIALGKRTSASQLLVLTARGKSHGVIAGLVPAISIRMAQCHIIGMAGTSPAMTKAGTATSLASAAIHGRRKNNRTGDL
jgi:hypothetical protein